MMIADLVRKHYAASWGEPSRQALFRDGRSEVEICKWAPDSNPEGVHLYATVGASIHAMAGVDPNHRVEFFVGLLPPIDDIASPLAALALYPVREKVLLDHGHTVPSDAPLWLGTAMRRLLVLRPVTPIVSPLALGDGVHVEFLQAVPIFESELEYKSQHGIDALLRVWEESRVRFWDPRRRPHPAAV
jgi:hypothetical protein